MVYNSRRSVRWAYRMSRCLRVLVNVPKCSSKTGTNWWRGKALRVRVRNLVINRRSLLPSLGSRKPSPALIVCKVERLSDLHQPTVQMFRDISCDD